MPTITWHPLTLLPALLLATACADPRSTTADEPPAPTPSPRAPWFVDLPDSPTWVHRCEGGQTFSVRLLGGDTALVTHRLDEYRLPPLDATGQRHGDGRVTLEQERSLGTLTLPGARFTGCRIGRAELPWEASRLLGYQFRGVGQEPGWTVEIAEGDSMRILADYGEVRLLAPTPAPQATDAAGGVRYETRSGEHEVVVEIAPRRCSDTMSGEITSHTVTLRLDGREMHGCGRPLARPSGGE